MTATTGHLVRSSHPEDDAAGRVFAPGDVVPDLDVGDPYNQEKIEAGIFYEVDGEDSDAAPDGGSEGPNATDAAVRLAEDKQIDLSTIIGSGEGSRITKDDVQNAIDAQGDGSADESEGDD